MAPDDRPRPARQHADLEELLRPTLGEASAQRPLYTVQAGFLTAFFGGLYAACLIGGLNSRRLGRLARDAWIYAVAALAWTATLLWFGYGSEAGLLGEGWRITGGAGRTLRFGGRLLALVLFGLIHLRHRPMIRLQQLLGTSPPNPWPVALTAIAGGCVLTLLFIGLGTLAARV